jgi:hypothetical protein
MVLVGLLLVGAAVLWAFPKTSVGWWRIWWRLRWALLFVGVFAALASVAGNR